VGWSELPYERRLSIIILAITGVLVLGAIVALPEGGGRVAIGLMALGALGLVAAGVVTGRKYRRALAEAAQRTGLHLVTNKDDDAYRDLWAEFKRLFDRDTRTWKVAGRFPCLVGRIEGLPVSVRVPLAVDFDYLGPECTRIAVHFRSKVPQFTIYNREMLKKLPSRIVETGDDAFDRKFVVIGRQAEAIRELLGEQVRQRLLRWGRTGFKGIAVSRTGVFLYELGRVTDPEVVVQALEILTLLAKRAVDRDES